MRSIKNGAESYQYNFFLEDIKTHYGEPCSKILLDPELCTIEDASIPPVQLSTVLIVKFFNMHFFNKFLL